MSGIFIRFLLFLLSAFYVTAIQAAHISDTVTISIQQAEQTFIERNLLLLANNYDVEASKARILQAKLWPNPTVEIQQGIYNQYTEKYLDATKTGQSSVQVSQLIYLAGKRNKNVTLQKINSELAEAQLYDLLRILKFELRTTAYDLYYKQRSMVMYEAEIASLKNTVALYEVQYNKGNIPLKEIIRLQAFLISLENEKYAIASSVYEDMQRMYVLMSDTVRPYYQMTLPDNYGESFPDQLYSLDSLYEVALTSRSDLKIRQLQVVQSRQIHTLEKANAYPDMHVGAIWDRASNYIPNYNGLIIGFDLPAFNRNQGNIKVAENEYEKSMLSLQYSEQNVMSEVLTAYRQLTDYNFLYRTGDKNFIGEFDTLMDGILLNYQKRNINLIEFIDFYETYKNNVNTIYQLRSNRLQAIEYLNFTTGANVYEFK